MEMLSKLTFNGHVMVTVGHAWNTSTVTAENAVFSMVSGHGLHMVTVKTPTTIYFSFYTLNIVKVHWKIEIFKQMGI